VKKSLGFTQSLYITSLLILVAGIVWVLFLGINYSGKKETRFVLKFPNQQTLQISFQGEYTWSEGGITQPQFGTFSFRGVATAPIEVVGNSCSLSVTLSELYIYDKELDRLLLSYEKRSVNESSYTTSSEWSEEERKHIFKLFEVDLSSNTAYDDHSLLTQELVFNVNSEGRLIGIELSKPLRERIYTQIRGKTCAFLFWDLLTYPHALPSLLPKNSTLKEAPLQWKTQGSTSPPLHFMHSRVVKDTHFWYIDSSGENENQQWLLKWIYHPNTQRLLHLDLAWNGHSPHSYQTWQRQEEFLLKLQTQFEYLDRPSVSEKLQDFAIGS
jgi:hypothetical protein